MPSDTSNLLQQLRGLHLPEAVSWWPMAIGWWLVIICTVLVVSIVIRKLINKRNRDQYRKVALLQLNQFYLTWQQDANSSHYLQSANAILTRIVRHLETKSDKPQASLSGSHWGVVLNSYAGHALAKQSIQAISEDCYKAKPVCDIDQLHTQLCEWINTHQGESHA